MLGAAAALAIAVLGVQVVRQQDQLDDMESALDADHAPGRRQPGLRRPRPVQLDQAGDTTASAVLLPDGSGYLMAPSSPVSPTAPTSFDPSALSSASDDPHLPPGRTDATATREGRERRTSAVKVELQSDDGDTAASGAVLPDGSGFLMAHELPGLAGDRTYQLWGDTGDERLVSLGLLGADPATVAFQAGADLSALAITEEDAGGVERSENAAVDAGAFD